MLLQREDFDVLNEVFSNIQAGYRDGVVDEEELRAAFRVFYVTDPTLEAHFNAWTQRYPAVYVAQLARGIYFKYVGMERRGNDYISHTTDKQMQGMRTANQEAAKSLYSSFQLDQKPLLSYLHAIDLSADVGNAEECRRLLDLALQIDPHDFIVRYKYIGTLRTRWGGSLEQMTEFYAESRRAGLRLDQLKLLEGMVAEEKAWTSYRDGNYKKGVRADEKAVNLGRPGCLPCFVQDMMRDGHPDEAIAALDAELKRNPKDINALRLRADVYQRTGRNKEWIEDLKAGVALNDPASQIDLGVRYMSGVAGVLPQNPVAGKDLFQRALKNARADSDIVQRARQDLEAAEYMEAHPGEEVRIQQNN